MTASVGDEKRMSCLESGVGSLLKGTGFGGPLIVLIWR